MIFSLFFRWFFCINIFLDICGRKRNYVVFFLISLNTNKPKHWILFRLGLVVGSWGSSIWTDGCCTMFKYDSHFCRLSWVPRYSEVLMKRGHCLSGSVYICLVREEKWSIPLVPSVLPHVNCGCPLPPSPMSQAAEYSPSTRSQSKTHLLKQWWIEVASLFTLILLKWVTALHA